jgi:hypothetical protein
MYIFSYGVIRVPQAYHAGYTTQTISGDDLAAPFRQF